ncbi:MAG: hypothetical protein L0338_28770 [Acidobacteria bacterium]|nr:hypothetical protein [Acidobacteriota bacterium]
MAQEIETAQSPRMFDREAAKTPSQSSPIEETRHQVTRWPPALASQAFYGLAGDIVHAIERYSESDPAALLIQLLAGFGSAAGHGPRFRVEGSP